MYQKPKKTVELMRNAYLELLTKKSYLDITVTDVVNEAGVSRVSFYRNYDGIGDVAIDIMDRFYDMITKDVIPMFMVDKKSAWKKLLLNIYGNIHDNRISHLQFLPENSSYMMSYFSKKLQFKFDDSSLEKKYLPFINVSTMIVCARVWVENGMKETPEELADYVYKIICRNIESEN